MVVNFSIVPIGKGNSLSTQVAEVLKIVSESGINYKLHAMGTILEDLVEKEKEERIDVIALHNLHVLMKTVKESKEAIREGRLWEYLGSKARCHPRLWEAFKRDRKSTRLNSSH